MLTKQQIIENLKKKYGNVLTRQGINEGMLVNFIQEQCMLYAKPNCLKCMDKGFSSVMLGASEGDGPVGEMRPRIMYCTCDRGKQLKDLIAANYKAI